LLYCNTIIEEEVLKGGARIIINAPPRHGKSLNCSKWLPTWYLENFPDKRVVIGSYQDTFASKWGGDVKEEFDNNELLTARLNPNKKRENEWELIDSNGRKTGGGLKTAGVGGGLTGWGGDLMVMDDPTKNWEDAFSETYRRRLWNWWTSVWMPRLEPNASVIIIMTRWAPHDLTAVLESGENGKDWIHINFPAVATGVNDPIGRLAGEALCPQRYPVDALEGIRRTIGSHKFEGLYQQHPTSVEGSIIKRAWCNKRWDVLPTKFDSMIQSWDTSYGSIGPDASFVVGQVWGKIGQDKYLIHEVRKRMTQQEQRQAIRNMTKLFPEAVPIVIEDAASARGLNEDLRKEIKGIVLYRPKGDKLTRLDNVSVDFETGHVILPADSIAPWIGGYIEEIISAAKGNDMDRADATSQGIDYLNHRRKPRHGVPGQKR